jgi:2,3-diketo-5-methylthio-1-phosphopentane phosphatase
MIPDNQTPVLVTDFDGTITGIDFFVYVVQNYLEDLDLQPWRDYKAGKARHFEALCQIFSKVHISEKQMHEDILLIPFDQGFIETVKFCKKHDIKVYITSAGADFYIKKLLESYNILNDVTIFSNESYYNSKEGLQMIKRKPGDLFFSDVFGIDKSKVIDALKNDRTYVIFAGDGDSDHEPAMHADKIFARKTLLEFCQDKDIAHTELREYTQILEYLNNAQTTA